MHGAPTLNNPHTNHTTIYTTSVVPIRARQRPMPPNYYVNRKSFMTGELENSGLRRTQLGGVSALQSDGGWGRRTYLRKYCSPIRLCSRNCGRNLETTPLGGRGGMEASERGKVMRRFWRRVSNSEYRFLMLMVLP